MTLLLAGLGAVIGSLGRYWFTNFSKKHFNQKNSFPFGTLIINLSGAFLLGLLFSIGTNPFIYALLGTGILGGYTTFSTLNAELIVLLNNHSYLKFFLYALLSYLGGILAIFLGFFYGQTALNC